MQIGELVFQYCSDVDLIALLLGGRKAARRKATQLLKDAGSLRRLIEADGKTVGRLAYARLRSVAPTGCSPAPCAVAGVRLRS